ncbi:hypothetical protein FF38_08251 [Lucilia cuprina]|uniref:Uncharacterized protein n=1 Tax=Lucilia cuprina TaxID=7375 RepID=A0A0L0BYS4_LUCCU|nr:hypothetical protein FF38_08251 [Lucilia cuprina]
MLAKQTKKPAFLCLFYSWENKNTFEIYPKVVAADDFVISAFVAPAGYYTWAPATAEDTVADGIAAAVALYALYIQFYRVVAFDIYIKRIIHLGLHLTICSIFCTITQKPEYFPNSNLYKFNVALREIITKMTPLKHFKKQYLEMVQGNVANQ